VQQSFCGAVEDLAYFEFDRRTELLLTG